MDRWIGVTALALFALGAVGCEAMKNLAEATGRTKVSMTLKNGQKIEGTLLKDEDGQSCVQVSYGSVTVRTGDVASVEKTGAAPEPVAGDGRMSRWDHCLHIVASSWSRALVQVPATVVDMGVLKNVPYLSHRSGEFEMNIYGDPDRPAGLEIGLFQGGASHEERKTCLETMCRLLTDEEDRKALRSMGLKKGTLKHGGLVFEVTPPEDKDSYGGWWITVYDLKLLAEQRASDAELASITVAPVQLKPLPQPPATAVGVRLAPVTTNPLHWQDSDLKNARRVSPEKQHEHRVYKRGVHRKNGVYVVTN